MIMIQEYAHQKMTLELSIWNIMQELGFETFEDLFIKCIKDTKTLDKNIDSSLKLHFNKDELSIAKINHLINDIICGTKPIRSKFERKLNKFLKERFNMKKEDFYFLQNFEINTEENDKKLEVFKKQIIKTIKKEDRQIFTDCATYFMYRNLPFKDTSCENCISEYINIALEIDDDIHNSKLYEKYKNKRISELATYLGVAPNEICKLFHTIINELNFTGFKEYNEDLSFPMNKESLFDEKKVELIDLEYPINQQILDPYFIALNEYPNLNIEHIDRSLGGIAYFVRAYVANKIIFDEDLFYDSFYKALDLSLLLNLRDYIDYDKEDREFKISMIVRMAEIKDMNSFLTQLLYLTFMDMSIHLYKHFLRTSVVSDVPPESIERYSDVLDEQNAYIESLENDNDDLKQKLESLKDENIKLNKSLKDKDIENKKIQAKLNVESYIDEIDELKRKLDKIEKKYNVLLEEQDELKELRRIVMTDKKNNDSDKEELFDINKINFDNMKNKRYIFIGGHYTVLRKLNEVFPKSKQYHNMPQGGIDVNKTDMIIIFPNFVNHPIYWSAIKLAKDNNIPFMFSTSSNFENIIEDIVIKEESLK